VDDEVGKTCGVAARQAASVDDAPADTIRPWCVRLEQSMNRFLLNERERGKFFFEFNLAGLLRGDTVSRFNAYATARNWGWMNVDEIRSLENMNPLPDKKGQLYLQPLNMGEPGEKPPEKPIEGGDDAGKTKEPDGKTDV
jgi:hypothetical protein